MAKTNVAHIQKGPAKETRKLIDKKMKHQSSNSYRTLPYLPRPIHVSNKKGIFDAFNTQWEFSFLKGRTHNSVISCIKDRGDWNVKAKTPPTIRWIKTLICLWLLLLEDHQKIIHGHFVLLPESQREPACLWAELELNTSIKKYKSTFSTLRSLP